MYEMKDHLLGIHIRGAREKGCIAKETHEGEENESHRKQKTFIQIKLRVRSGMLLGMVDAEEKWLKINTTR